MNIKKIIKDGFTEKNGESFCPVRSFFIIGMIAYLGFTIRDFVYSTDVHFMEHAKEWISGLGDYIGLGGAAVAGKNFTEDKDD